MSTKPEKTRSLYWHDYETFGTNPRLDRPAQFAGIRTDLNFNPIGEPLELYRRPTDDYLPNPEACLMTGITPKQAAQKGLAEPDFIARILQELGTPGTCGIGYNSIRFDDEFTRFACWRNFHDPYEHTYKNDCSRWDIIDVARLAYALRPEGIEWPRKEDGSPSFKLGDLAEANGLEQQRAHDALSDVRTTIALARLIQNKKPKLYAYAFDHRDKKSVLDQLDLSGHVPVLHISRRYPATRGCLALVMPLAPLSSDRKEEVLVYDLRVDPTPLLTLDAGAIHERVFTSREDLPEGADRIPIKKVSASKCPVLAPVRMAKDLPEKRARAFELDLDACRRHWKMLYSDIKAVAAKVQAVFAMSEFPPREDPEQSLYDGFPSNEDQSKYASIREASGEELAQRNVQFEDPRLSTLLFRYRARNYPETLSESERDRWERWRSTRLEKAPDGGRTLAEYDATIERLSRDVGPDPEKLQILMDLKEWSAGIRPVPREE